MARRDVWLCQHFLKDRRLVASMVAQAGIGRDDTVYEIGPGRGMITRELAKVCARVVAIEIDPELFAHLRRAFGGNPRIELHNGDFLDYEIRGRNYKVFSNIPFGRTADIVRKLLHPARPPEQAYLIVQEGAAQKLAGIPRERLWSLQLKPWFSLKVVRRLARTDFRPPPQVGCVLLRIARRSRPLVTPRDAQLYERFLSRGLRKAGPTAWQNLRNVFTHTQWKRLARELGFAVNARPTEIGWPQWLGLFGFLLTGAERGQVRIPAGWLAPRHQLRRRAPARQGESHEKA